MPLSAQGSLPGSVSTGILSPLERAQRLVNEAHERLKSATDGAASPVHPARRGKSGFSSGIVTVSSARGELDTFAPSIDLAGNSVKRQEVNRVALPSARDGYLRLARSTLKPHTPGGMIAHATPSSPHPMQRNLLDPTARRRALDASIGLMPFVLLVALIAGCSREAPPAPEALRPVRTFVVAAGEETSERTFPGRVEASNKVQLAFQVPGLLVSLPVREGQHVAKGDVVAQLRQDEFQARLNALQGQLDRARADLQGLRAGARPEERQRLEAQVRGAEAKLENARTEFSRSERLLRTGAIAQADHDRAVTAYRVAQEQYESARQLLAQGTTGRTEDIEAQEAAVRGLEGQVVEANVQLQDSTLRAPYDGVIAQRFVQEGQTIRVNEPVVKFQDADEIEIVVDVPEAFAANELRSSDIEQITAGFSAAPGRTFPAIIKEVAQRADPTTQTFSIRVAIEAPADVALLPGMTSTVTFAYRRARILEGRILIPITALAEDESGGSVAWKVSEEGEVARVPVKIGEVAGGNVEIVDGLAPGDRIVIAGVSFLHDGMKVRDLGDALGSRRP